MSLLSVGAATINWGSYVQSQDHCRWRQLLSPGVYIDSPGLLQRNIARLAWLADETPPRRDYITPILRQLHLLPVRRLQDRRPGLAVLDWSGTWLPGGGAVSSSPALADFDQQIQRPASVTRRTSNIFGDRCFAAAGPPSTAMELAANQAKTVSQSGTIQTFAKDIPV